MKNYEMRQEIPVIIPAYEPDSSLIDLCKKISQEITQKIIVIDDGSGEEYREIFQSLKKENIIVLNHVVNMGKGRALKDAFNYVLNAFPDILGVITADSDNQHSLKDIRKCRDALCANPDKLILGCRKFSGDNVPWKSKVGNEITKKICSYLCGIKISDTQTGLRGIPKNFMKICLTTPGERFEYETNMLIKAKDETGFLEVPIKTIYESSKNHKTHFNPVADSVRIYKIFMRLFVGFFISSLSSSIVDLVLFTIFCSLIKKYDMVFYAGYAVVFARVISAAYNYIINYKLVFASRKKMRESAVKYVILAIFQMLISAFLTMAGVRWLMFIPEIWIKITIDTVLFFVSYKIQQKYVF
jgi:glycosyltransferase involved in cell wall biosynthesis